MRLTCLTATIFVVFPVLASASDIPREAVFDRELQGTLSATAEGTGGTSDTSSQSARATLDAGGDLGLTLPELHPGDPWAMPVLTVGGGVDAELVGGTCDGCDAERGLDLQGSAEARVQAMWATARYRETYQRPVQFNDGYWRNERGTIRRAVGVDVKGLLPLESAEYLGYILPFRWERRELFGAELENYFEPSRRLGHEHEWSFALGRVSVFTEEGVVGVNLLDVRLVHSIVPPGGPTDTDFFPLYETPPTGSIRAYELDVTAIELWSSTDAGTLRLSCGMTSRRPASTVGFADPETSGFVDYSLAYGQGWALGHKPGWEEAGERRPRHREMGWMVQVEDFHRIDGTGLAADAGHQLGVDVAYRPLSPLTLSARAIGVFARRKVISPLRDPSAEMLAEVGDYLLMGRVELQADWQLHGTLSVTANSWAERSDRADPLRPAVHRAVIPLDTNLGAWVGLAFHPFD